MGVGVLVMVAWRQPPVRLSSTTTLQLPRWYDTVWYGVVCMVGCGMVVFSIVWYGMCVCVALGPCNYPPAYTRAG